MKLLKMTIIMCAICILSSCGGGGGDTQTVQSCVAIPGVGYTPPGVGIPVSCTSTTVSTTPSQSTAGLCCYTANYSYSMGSYTSLNPTIRACGAGEKPTLKC